MLQRFLQFLKKNIWLITIIILAGIIRIYRIDQYMTFLGDEGRDAIIVYNILHGKLTLLGPTASVGGFFMGPAYYYLIAPFLWLFQYNPIGPSIFVALVSLVTIVLIYKLCREFFNKPVGLIAAFFYAISPVVIVYSRSSWNPNVMPFFTLVTLYTLYEGIKRNKWWLFIICGIFFGIDIQLHYTELFVGAIIIAYTLLSRLTERTKQLHQKIKHILLDGCSIFLGFLIGFSPFIAFEVRHGFQNAANIVTFIFHSKDVGGEANFLGNVWDVFFRLFGRIVSNFPTSSEQSMYTSVVLIPWICFVIFLAIGSVILLIYKLYYEREKRDKFLQYSLLLLWLGIGIFFFGFYKKSIYDYYLQFLFPLPFILIGNLLVFLWARHPIGKIVSGISFLVITGICLWVFPFRFEPNNQLNRTREIATFVLTKTQNMPYNFAYISSGNSDHAFRYFFKLAGKDSVPIENTINDPKRTTVTDQLLVICDTPCKPQGHPLWEVAGFGEAKIADHWKVAFVEVYKLVHTKKK